MSRRSITKYITVFFLSLSWGNNITQAEELVPLPIAFMDYTFAEVSKEDTKVAIDFYLQKLMHHTGNEPQAEIFTDLDALRQALKNKDVLMASLSSPDFLRLKPEALIEPILTRTKANGDIFDTFVILANKNKNKNWSTLKDVEKTSLRIPKNDDLVKYWIQVALANESLPDASQHFSAIEEDLRSAQSVLSVFFGKSDICIVNTSIYETMSQLNPQISEQLVPIVTSPPFLTGLLCAHVEMSTERRDTITNSTLTLSQSEDGRQVIRLFKTKEVVSFRDEYLNTIVELFDQYQKHYGTTELSF